MLHLNFDLKDKNLKILCLGAHADDIEIGCGGTLLKLIDFYFNVEVKWIVFSSDQIRKKEALLCANQFLEKAEKSDVSVLSFHDGYFPYIGEEIKDYFEKLKLNYSPDMIFTHYKNDYHQDHRLISELTWNTFRDHLIFEYEILKYDGDLGQPNFFVHLSRKNIERKIKLISENFISQKDRTWFDEETFRSLLRIRGVESSAPEKYAEAFYVKKLII